MTEEGRDCFGYLRWTATSCARCGYEQKDCTCIGGFADPKDPELVKNTLAMKGKLP